MLLAGSLAALASSPALADDLADLSLEQLANVVVSTVSGRAEPISRALASVYVITADDIRRSGATSLMEALRLAPNLEVARTGTNGYAITARGFNGTFANKLLVLIDGRSIYTPTFSGVFWDAQDVMLEDVDRIEVISGPGGVLWGANAVNGVINVLTKPAADTRDGLITAGGGNAESRLQGRYGGRFESGHYRGYAQLSRQENSEQPDGLENADGDDRLQGGFRTDWSTGPNAWTVQGDGYGSRNNQEPDPQELRGANLLGRWSRDLGGGDSLRVQVYYDDTSRAQQRLDTADFEFGHALAPRGAHRLLWGAGARRARDRIDNTAAFAFIPDDKDLNSWNLYVQDEIALRDDLDATVGVRADRNSYTGVEYLPSLRLGWRPGEKDLLWASASRAVRTPSRFDRELFLPGTPPFLLAGGPDFEPEIADVYEIGYRSQPISRVGYSATAFYHDLEKQRSIAPGPAAAVVANGREGHAEGFETWGYWLVTDRWRLSGGYTHLHKNLTVRSGEIDLQPESSIGSDPEQWWKLRSALDLGRSWELDLLARRYGALDTIDVPAYLAVDARVGWSPSARIELSMWMRNLTDAGHIEWSPGAEFDRTAYFEVLFRF